MRSALENRPLDTHSAGVTQRAAEPKFDFHQVSVKAAGDERLKAAINNAVLRQYTGRQQSMRDLPDPDRLRTIAGEIKQHAIENLDHYLEQLQASVEKNGGHVHF